MRYGPSPGRRPLRVAVIGLGVGAQHAAAYARLPTCTVAALCDSSQERLAAQAAAHPTARLTERADEVIADPDIDVISIASYDDDHFAHALAALEAGKHVFVEKPLCRSFGELVTLKRCWDRRRHLRLGSNLVLRAAPLYRWLRAELRSGRLGRLYSFDGDYLYGRLEKITHGWRRSVTDYSVMLGGGVHLVDLLLWLSGERPRSVAASGNRICTESSDFRYDDFAAAEFRFSSGLVGRISANFGCVHRHQHVVRAFGTRATFLYDDTGARLHESREAVAASCPIEASALPTTKGDLIPDFVDALLDDRDTVAETQHEFDVLAACVAADQSRGGDCFLNIEYP